MGYSREIREAKEWRRRLRTSADDSVRQDFAKWLAASPSNRKAFKRVDRLETGKVSVLPVELQSKQNIWHCVLLKVIGRMIITAAVAVTLLIAWTLPRHLTGTIDRELSSDIGERRTVTLVDGSSVQLNTNSHVGVHYTATQRELSLDHGEISIKVAVDSHRPFRVYVNNLVLEDIGTTFTVRTSPTETRVYVDQGRIRLSSISPMRPAGLRKPYKVARTTSLEIGSGEQVIVKAGESGTPAIFPARTVTRPESERLMAWTHGLLILRDEGEVLADVIKELNRYHKRQIVIADPRLGTLKLGGRFDPATNDYKIIISTYAQYSNCPVTIDESDPMIIRLRTGKNCINWPSGSVSAGDRPL